MRKIKLKAGENVSPTNVARVIAYLGEPKSTKKIACEMLGISYNTTRLANIIEDYNETVARTERLKAKKRGTAIDSTEAASIISEYLETASMQQVSNSHYRSVATIKTVIHKYGADLISLKSDYFRPHLIPEAAVRTVFKVGELVWSARYNCMAEIRKPTNDGNGYWIWVLGEASQQSAQATEELGSLEHLASIGVDLERLATRINIVE